MYAVFFGLLFAYTGCNDILEDVEPSTSVSGEVALTSVDGVNSIRASMYSKLRSQTAFTTELFVSPSPFTDETRNRPGTNRHEGYVAAVGTSGTTHLGNFGAGYNLIQDANLLIGAIEDGVLDDAVRDQYRGEAYALRAFAYHTMVRVYGYEPGNYGIGELEGNWDLGVILRTEPVINVADADLRPRSTVDQVYAQIFSDLESAKQLLAGNNSDNTYITEAFVDGLKARAHLYAGNWSEAADAAQDAIDNFPGTLQSTPESVAQMFNENQGNHPEALFKIVVNPDTEASTGGNSFINNGPAAFTSDQWVPQLPTQFLMDKYSEEDYRLGWYQPCQQAQRIGSPAVDCTDVNEGGFSIIKFNGVKGNAVDDLPYMRIAEVYLIRAEALARASNDPNAGASVLNELRSSRGLGAVPSGALANMNAFEDEILDERMRELAVEGHRFFDLKRLGRDIRNPDASRSIKMRADSYRILAPFGNTLLGINPELVENPGYN